MRRAEWPQQVRRCDSRKLTYSGWRGGRLTQEEAARILGSATGPSGGASSGMTTGGLRLSWTSGLSQVSHLRAPVDEVMALAERYRNRYAGWNVRHFHAHYLRGGGARSSPGSRAGCRKPGWSPGRPGGAPTASDGAIALARHDAASGRQPPRVGPRTEVGSHRSPWTTPLASITPCSSSTRRHPEQFQGIRGCCPGSGVVWLPHGPGEPLLAHPPGRRQQVDRTHPTQFDGRCGSSESR